CERARLPRTRRSGERADHADRRQDPRGARHPRAAGLPRECGWRRRFLLRMDTEPAAVPLGRGAGERGAREEDGRSVPRGDGRRARARRLAAYRRLRDRPPPGRGGRGDARAVSLLAPVRPVFRAAAEAILPAAGVLDEAGWAAVEEVVENALAQR